MNRWIGKGRLTRDIEVKYVQSNKGNIPVAQFSIACNRDKEHTDFINCVAWDKRAEFLKQYFSKGQEILVEGRLQARSWQDEQQKKHSITEVVIESVEFCGSKKENVVETPADIDFSYNPADDDSLPF